MFMLGVALPCWHEVFLGGQHGHAEKEEQKSEGRYAKYPVDSSMYLLAYIVHPRHKFIMYVRMGVEDV